MLKILIPAVFFCGFIGIWMTVIGLLRRLSRMTDTVPETAGAPLRTSGWGSATVNGTRANNCIRVEQFASGYAIKMHPVFGGGLVWLPNGSASFEDDNARIRIKSAAHDIVLTNKLREFINDTAPTRAPRIDRPRDTSHPGSEHSIATGVGFAPEPRKRRPWTRLGLVLALLLVMYVVVRRVAPDLVAPIESLLQR